MTRTPSSYRDLPYVFQGLMSSPMSLKSVSHAQSLWWSNKRKRRHCQVWGQGNGAKGHLGWPEGGIRSEQGTKKVKFMQVMDGFLMAECGGGATRLSRAGDRKLVTHTRVPDNV